MRLAWIRVRKRPLIAVAVLLFIAIIAMALCSLYRGKDNAHEHYNDICNTIEVRCTVTNLAGDQSDHYDGCTVVIVTHDPAVAEQADKVLQMKDGSWI